MNIGLITAYDISERGLARITIPNKQAYCDIRKYTLITSKFPRKRERPILWYKIALLLENLAQYDYCVWSDCDSLIMDEHKQIEDIIVPDCDIFTSLQWIDKEHGTSSIHTGNFIIKNSKWSYSFLTDLWNSYNHSTHLNSMEIAFSKLYFTYPHARKRVRLLPVQIFCSVPVYYQEHNNTINSHQLPVYTGNEFIIKVPEPLNMNERTGYLAYIMKSKQSQPLFKSFEYTIEKPLSPVLSEIFIQTATGCNARCVICPHEQIYNTSNIIMKDALWDKISQEIHDTNYTGSIAFAYNYEPFCDPYITKRIQDIHDSSLAHITLTTNAAAITDTHIEEMRDNPPDLIIASLISGNKEQYEHMTGLSFDRVIQRIAELHSYFSVQVNCTLSPAVRKESFLSIFNNTVDVLITGCDSRGGLLPRYSNFYKSDYFKKAHFCTQPFKNITIRQDGKVPLCCMDWGCNTDIIGDVNTTTLYDIFNSPLLSAYREHLYCGEYLLSPCQSCANEFTYNQAKVIT